MVKLNVVKLAECGKQSTDDIRTSGGEVGLPNPSILGHSDHDRYSGFIVLVGRPNVGKSTLLNKLIQQKVSITSRKAQTTRYQIVGIKTVGARQLVYLDTPGFNGHVQNELQHYLTQVTKHALQDADIIVWVVAGSRFTAEDRVIGELITKLGKPIIAVINKRDLVKGDSTSLVEQQQRLQQWPGVVEQVTISAKYSQGLETLECWLLDHLSAGPWFYDASQCTDRDEHFWVAEVVREKLMRLLGDELPYATTVITDRIVRRAGLVTIDATIYVERLGQKIIVIGQRGGAIKRIGSLARAELEKSLGCQVMLNLWVKIKTNWTRNADLLRKLGYNC